MKEYISNQEKINKPDYVIYSALSDFNNFSPMLADKVDGWSVEGDICTFKVKGLTLKLAMTVKEPNKLIKLEGVDMPFEGAFWLQIKGLAPDDTRIRIVVKVKLNAMMKMMVGKKIQHGIDEIAKQIATSFNSI